MKEEQYKLVAKNLDSCFLLNKKSEKKMLLPQCQLSSVKSSVLKESSQIIDVFCVL